MKKEINKYVVIATVEDWMSNELVRFEGEDCSSKAIDWKEDECERYARNDNGRIIDIDSDEYEQRYIGMSEDLYVIGYDKDNNKINVDFG